MVIHGTIASCHEYGPVRWLTARTQLNTVSVYNSRMNFEALVQLRSSVRAYADTPVPAEAISQCLEAARLAPSACNAQPWHYIIVSDDDRRKELARTAVPPAGAINRFVGQAPVIVAVVAERPNIASQIGAALKNKPFYLIDIGISAEHFCLQAAELGLGTCMIGWFDENKARRLLSVPKSRRLTLLITLGYPAAGSLEQVSSGSKRRKALDAIASAEVYRQP